MTPEQITDLVLLAGAVTCAIWGLWRGAIKQLGSVAAFLCAFLVARLFGAEVASWLGVSPMWVYMALFVVVFIAVTLLATILKFTARLLMLGPVDKLLGALIGLVQWTLLCSLLLNLARLAGMDWPIFGSRLAQLVTDFAPWLFGYAAAMIPV